MSRSVLRMAAVAAFVTLAAVGCGGGEEPPSKGAPPTTAPVSETPSAAVVTWAGTICSDVNSLRAAVQEVAGAWPDDPDASEAETRARIKARVDAVHQAGQALLSTLHSPPQGAGAELSSTANDLSESAAQVRTQIDAMWTAANAVAGATSEADVKAAVTELRSTVLSASTALSTYVDDLRLAFGDSSSPVKSAFAAAPSCAEIPATASPSS